MKDKCLYDKGGRYKGRIDDDGNFWDEGGCYS